MIDWIEGHITLNKMMKDLYAAMLVGDFKKATEICDEMIVEARLTKAKIGAQNEALHRHE